MEIIVIHKLARRILHRGQLVILPGIGSNVYIDESILLDLRMETLLNIDPSDSTTVLELEHCLITGDTKVYVGSSSELTKSTTGSSVVSKNTKGSRGDNDNFLDGLLLAAAVMSSND